MTNSVTGGEHTSEVSARPWPRTRRNEKFEQWSSFAVQEALALGFDQACAELGFYAKSCAAVDQDGKHWRSIRETMQPN